MFNILRFKEEVENWIIITSWNDLYKLSIKIFGITQKPLWINPLSVNPTKWSSTLKQFVGKLPTNCLGVFDHFVKLALQGLMHQNSQVMHHWRTKRSEQIWQPKNRLATSSKPLLFFIIIFIKKDWVRKQKDIWEFLIIF